MQKNLVKFVLFYFGLVLTLKQIIALLKITKHFHMIAGNLWYRKIDSSTAFPPCQSLVPNGCGSIHIASSLPLIGVYRSFLMTLLFLIGGYRYVLFSQCRSRDDTHGNNFFDTSSSARANVRVNCEEDKRKLTPIVSHDKENNTNTIT